MSNIMADADCIIFSLEKIENNIAWCRVAEGEYKNRLVFMNADKDFFNSIIENDIYEDMFYADVRSRHNGRCWVNYLEF